MSDQTNSPTAGEQKGKKSVRFVSKCHNQVLVMRPNRSHIVDGMPVQVPGQRIAFSNFEYVTGDAKEIEFIRKHNLFGSAIAEAAESK